MVWIVIGTVIYFIITIVWFVELAEDMDKELRKNNVDSIWIIALVTIFSMAVAIFWPLWVILRWFTP